jgi:thiol-disulfide isomerase/thioredoxin
MRRILIFLVALPFLISWDCRPAAPPVSVSNKPVTAGERQPMKPISEMSWTDSEQRVHKLADLKGKAVILDFWATYCPPCREEIPHLNALLEKYGADNLYIVGLNVGGAEDLPRIPDFVKNTKIDYPIAFPEDELTQFVFGERDDIPQTAVFDRKGTMVTKIVGFSPAIQKELDAAVEQAMRTE